MLPQLSRYGISQGTLAYIFHNWAFTRDKDDRIQNKEGTGTLADKMIGGVVEVGVVEVMV